VLTISMNTNGAAKKIAVHSNVGALAQRVSSDLKRRGGPGWPAGRSLVGVVDIGTVDKL